MPVNNPDHDGIRALALIAEAYRRYEEIPALNAIRANCRQLVRGSGYVRSPVMLIGEAPGEEEDKCGMPFVGRSGQLLDKLLAGQGFPRGMCYTTNVLCYRPAGNRAPYNFEIAVSRERLLTEVEAVGPMLVITLGATARKAMRPDGDPVSACHGRLEDSRPVPTIGMGGGAPLFLEPSCDYKMLPTFHPSAALRDPAVLEMMTADLSYLRQFAPGGK
jgi:uracil-DNA glycosylase family 4